MLASTFGPFLKLVWPSWCLICGVSGPQLCDHCAQKICRKSERFDPHTLSLTLHQDLARELVLEAKYGDNYSLARRMGQLMAARLHIPFESAAVLYVPPHRPGTHRALEQMAKAFAQAKHWPLGPRGRWRRPTSPQKSAANEIQRQNLPLDSLIFDEALPHRVVIIDDVVTTGATLRAAEEAARQRGAQEVICATFSAAYRYNE